MNPLVSIIIPVYNSQLYIYECIKSIVDQTYSNLEILIINDGCSDDSILIVKSFSDNRIKIIENESNLGLATSVNKAIDLSQGSFIARMDADDIAVNSRIERQVNFLINNPDVSILGTAMQSIGNSNYLHQFPQTHQSCKAHLLFNVCFGHPTVMFRKSVFNSPENYYLDELQQYSEEYELWCRLVDKVSFANLPETLLYYRTFDDNTKKEATQKRKNNSFAIREKFIGTQLGVKDRTVSNIHDSISNLEKAKDYNQLLEWISWLDRIAEINLKNGNFDHEELKSVLRNRQFELNYWNSQLGLLVWIKSLSQNRLVWSQPIRKQIGYFLRSLLKL